MHFPQAASSWIEPLPPGHAGTMVTLKTMAWLARKDSRSPEVREVIYLLLRQPDLSVLPPAVALFSFARDYITYTPDPPNIEKVSDFAHLTRDRAGDCDDKVQWLATALLSFDVPVRFVVQSYDGQYQANGWDHIYLEFWDWTAWRWIAADPTADGHNGFIADLGWRQSLPPGGAEMSFEV